MNVPAPTLPPATPTSLAPPTPVAVALGDIPPVRTPSFDLSHGLQMIVELVQLLTHADGAALALRDKDQMVCRATIGSAPGIGAVVRSDSGLSGECMRTGLTVRSDDTSSDQRVDAEACRILNVGSIAVTPIFRDDFTHGILEILGRRPNTFSHVDIALRPQMAALVARLVSREKAERTSGPGSGSLTAKTNGTSAPMLTASVADAKTGLPEAKHKGRSYVPTPDEPGQGTIRIAPGTMGNA